MEITSVWIQWGTTMGVETKFKKVGYTMFINKPICGCASRGDASVTSGR
jgi:hypothetical protein